MANYAEVAKRNLEEKENGNTTRQDAAVQRAIRDGNIQSLHDESRAEKQIEDKVPQQFKTDNDEVKQLQDELEKRKKQLRLGN